MAPLEHSSPTINRHKQNVGTQIHNKYAHLIKFISPALHEPRVLQDLLHSSPVMEVEFGPSCTQLYTGHVPFLASAYLVAKQANPHGKQIGCWEWGCP